MRFEDIQYVVTVILILVAALSFVCGISYYLRFKHAGRLRSYVLLLGICTGTWCLGYGLIALCPNLELCMFIRKIAILAIDGFLLTDFLIVASFLKLKHKVKKGYYFLIVLMFVIDWLLNSSEVTIGFERLGNATVIFSKSSSFETYHDVFIVVLFLSMFVMGIVCLKRTSTSREKKFIKFFFISNLINAVASLPDTFLYSLYGYKLTTSGIGAFVSLVVIWRAAIHMDIFQNDSHLSNDDEMTLKKKYRYQYFATMLITFVGLSLLVYMAFGTSYRQTKADVVSIGKYSISDSAEKINNFFLTTKSVLEVTGRTAEYMLDVGNGQDEVLEYLTKESQVYKDTINESFTGIYGVFKGVYLDGIGWVPDEDYDIYTRPWYLAAINAEGKVAFTTPYVDAQTGKIMISVCQRLADEKSVISMDVLLDSFYEITDEINYSNSAIGMIVDNNGIVIAESEGGILIDETDRKELLKAIVNNYGELEIKVSGQKYMVFTSETMENMHIAMVVDEKEYLSSIRSGLYKNIFLSILIFAIVFYFCSMSYVNRLKALKAAQSKSSFLANMSHEIRTPINAVIGFNEMILHESSENNILEYARDVDASSKHLLSLINDILDFSKIESGKVNIIKVKYGTLSLINDISAMIKPRIDEKKLKFKLEVSPEIPAVLLGDEVRIRQIVMNLLTNAAKYTDKGQVVLSFSVKKGDEADDILLIVSVKDTGKGIREEDQAKLFESFTRVDEVKNRFVEGTGLGLAITNEFIRLMHGSIEVNSVYGEGSEFIVTIPQYIVDATPLGEKNAIYTNEVAEHKVHTMTFKAVGKRILVVDDVSLNCKVIVHQLKNTGLIIDVANSGAQAIAYDEENKYDLIFMDHMMPEMDGIECLHKIRASKLSKNHATKMIALTANAVSGMREMYIEEGFDDYLSKPANSRQLEEILRKYIPEDV